MKDNCILSFTDRAGNVNSISVNIQIPIEYELTNCYFADIPEEGDVIIPKYFVNDNKLYKVVKISYLFNGCKNLTSVTIPDSVTAIGDRTFNNCSELFNVNIPNSIIDIGNQAFCYCTKLQEIDIPNSVTNIGENAFSECSNLVNIRLPDNLLILGAHSFYKCTKLNSIIIPNTLTELCDQVFYNCVNLKEIFISDNITTINSSVFKGCTALKSIYIPISVQNIYGTENQTSYSSALPFYSCSSELKIYCGVESDPYGYKYYWNTINCKESGKLETVYGITREEYENNYKV